MKRLFFFVLFVVAACSNQKAEVEGGEVDTAVNLVLSIESENVRAGEPIAFELVWTHSDGEESPVEAFTMTSSLESELSVDSNTLTLTQAGLHDIEVTAEDASGTTQAASQTLGVIAGTPASLALVLSADSVTAGERVDATLSATDTYGNDASVEDASWTVPDSVEQDGLSFSTSMVGTYTLIAQLGDLTDEASWSVTAGPATTIDLTLADTDLDPGDDTNYTITVTDMYENNVDTEVDLTVSTGAIVEGDTITFETEGAFVCTASIPGTDLSDTETVIIDVSGPDLLVTQPERGDWTIFDTMTVEGVVTDAVSDVASLTVAGESVDVDDDGSFAYDMPVQYGINIIETVAIDNDSDSNESRDIRSVLQVGDWLSPELYREDALLVRINEGPGGLDQLGAVAPAIMESVDLESLLGGELYSTSGGFWPFLYAISMSATSVSYGDASVSVDAVSGGTLQIRLTITDLLMEFVVSGYAPFVSLPADGSVRIDAMYVDISVRPTIEDGALSFDEPTVSVPDPEGLSVSIGSGLGDLASFIGLDIDSLVVEEMRAAVGDAVSGETDGLLDGILGDFSIEETFDVGGMTYSLFAQPGTIEVDDDGMIMGFETRVEPEEVLSAGAVDGLERIPVFDWWSPDLGADGTGFQMALSTDVLNQMMFAMWQGGLLDQNLSTDDLGVDPALLSLVFPGVEELTIVTTPLLPPVFTPREVSDSDEVYDLTIGSLKVDVLDGTSDGAEAEMTLFVATKVPVALGVSETEIAITLGEASVYADLTEYSPDLSISPGSIEPLFGSIIAEFIPELTGDLSSIPLPSLDGFSIAIESTRMGGGDTPPGFWIAEGSLE